MLLLDYMLISYILADYIWIVLNKFYKTVVCVTKVDDPTQI